MMNERRPFSSITLSLTIIMGLVVILVSPPSSFALKKNPAVYNQCVCACGGPGEGGIVEISNAGGYSCGAYNNKTCNYEDPTTGGIRTSTTRWCQPYKPGGVRNAASAIVRAGQTGMVMSRGVEGEIDAAPGEYKDSAIPLSKPGRVMMNCACEGGHGNCSVTSTDGKTSTCHKGEGDSCTGTCAYPRGMISGTQ